jgi:hypothetical protein
MRIIPLTLRITHYTRAPAAWPGRPTIHVAGDWYTASAPPELSRVRGMVEMTGLGDVRWTLVRILLLMPGNEKHLARPDSPALSVRIVAARLVKLEPAKEPLADGYGEDNDD